MLGKVWTQFKERPNLLKHAQTLIEGQLSVNGSHSLYALSESNPRSKGSASPRSKAWGRAGSKEPVVGDACEAN